MERDIGIESMSMVHDLGGSPIWFDLERCFVLRSDEAIARQRTHVTGDPLCIIDRPIDAPNAPFKLLATFQEDQIGEAVATLSAHFANRLSVAQSGPKLVELVRIGTQKGLAASFIAAEYGWMGQDVAAAGDSDNDAEMLLWAGLSISVANARPHIQALADIVAPSCDEGGLALALRFLIDGN